MMSEVVSMAEADALLVQLDECWKHSVRAADQSDAKDVHELVERVRPNFRGGEQLASTLFDIGFGHFGWRNSNDGICGVFLTAFGYVAGLKLSLEHGEVQRNSDLAIGAFEWTREACEHILRAGPRARVEKAAKAARRRAEKLFGDDKKTICKLLSSKSDGWDSIGDAVKWVSARLEKIPGVRISYDNMPRKLREWIKEDPIVKAAFEANRRK